MGNPNVWFLGEKGRKQRSFWGKIALLFPGLLVYGFIFLIPTVLLFINSFQTNDPEKRVWEKGFTVQNYGRFFSDPYFLKVIFYTLFTGIIVVVLCILIGYLLAYRIYRAQSFGKIILITIVLTPLFSGALLQSLGWYVMLARYGPVNKLLMEARILSQPLNMLGTYPAVVVALVHGFLPFMVLSIVNSLRSLPTNVLDAAASLGANKWGTFTRVTFPLTRGGVMAGSVLVFGGTIGSFATPGIVGQGKIQLLAQVIYQQAIQVFDWSFASVISIILLFILALLALLLTLFSKYGRGISA